MRFAKWTFLIAGIYGLLVLLPQYFMEKQVGIDFPPAITHPEYFYGFVGLAATFQLLFLLISTDPIRYRPAMLVSVVEKISFLIPVAILFQQQRVPAIILGFSLIDGLLAVFFIISFLKTKTSSLDQETRR